ncbi:tyrosine-type recombinase/integrase [Amycolatopsis sp. NPDC004747]
MPLIEDIRELVKRRIALADNDPDGRLFKGPRGGRITTAVLRDATAWDQVVAKLGYDHLRRHDLRHTGLTWMADAGVPVHHLRKIAGHGSLSTTQRYLHPRQAVSPRRGSTFDSASQFTTTFPASRNLGDSMKCLSALARGLFDWKASWVTRLGQLSWRSAVQSV